MSSSPPATVFLPEPVLFLRLASSIVTDVRDSRDVPGKVPAWSPSRLPEGFISALSVPQYIGLVQVHQSRFPVSS
jgi:hypothetical protein